MESRSGYDILWLDAHISKPKTCSELKLDFMESVAPAATTFDSLIDQMICNVREFAAPITFASNIQAMLEMIEQRLNDHAEIILISSGSLGSQIIPTIRERGWPIHSYYIFCFDTIGHSKWVSPLAKAGVNIQMFDFELDLLICLARDLSNKMIEKGNEVFDDNPQGALSYFECARTLAETAVKRDTPLGPNDMHRPSIKHRTILDGENGLIAKARRACG